MLITRRKVEDLANDPRNVRLHSERNIDAVCYSLDRYGQQKPIVIDTTGKVIAGNGTLEAARRLGWTEISTVESDLKGDDATGYAIADNRSSELGTWDEELLADQLAELGDDIDLDALGFNEAELADLGVDWKPDDFDDAEPPLPQAPTPEQAITNAGDVWSLGPHRLVCGDSLDVATQQLALGGDTPKMVFTDPPYNVAYGTDHPPSNWRHRSMAGDNLSDAEWLKFCKGVAALCARVTDGCIYVCHAPGPDGCTMAQALNAELHWSGTIIWAKSALILGRAAYQRQYEPIWFGWPHKHSRTFTESRRITDLWEFDKPSRNEDHPTMKPLGLVARAVEHASAEGDLVFDPFAGSGTTVIACEKLARRASVIEIDAGYCDVIVKRWEQISGGQAKRIEAAA